MESPVQGGKPHGRKSHHVKRAADAERTQVAKSAEVLSRKAAIVYYLPVP